MTKKQKFSIEEEVFFEEAGIDLKNFMKLSQVMKDFQKKQIKSLLKFIEKKMFKELEGVKVIDLTDKKTRELVKIISKASIEFKEVKKPIRKK